MDFQGSCGIRVASAWGRNGDSFRGSEREGAAHALARVGRRPAPFRNPKCQNPWSGPHSPSPPTPVRLLPVSEELPDPRAAAGRGSRRGRPRGGREEGPSRRGLGSPARPLRARRSRPGFAAAAPWVPPPRRRRCSRLPLPPSAPAVGSSAGISCSRAAPPGEPPRPGPAQRAQLLTVGARRAGRGRPGVGRGPRGAAAERAAGSVCRRPPAGCCGGRGSRAPEPPDPGHWGAALRTRPWQALGSPAPARRLGRLGWRGDDPRRRRVGARVGPECGKLRATGPPSWWGLKEPGREGARRPPPAWSSPDPGGLNGARSAEGGVLPLDAV